MREIKAQAWDGNQLIDCYAFGCDELGTFYCEDNAGDFEYCIALRQYTGLKDKNGVEIYEGDIVIHTKQEIRGFIDYSEGTFLIAKPYISERSLVNYNCPRYVEVIGNIYENPELLGNNA